MLANHQPRAVRSMSTSTRRQSVRRTPPPTLGRCPGEDAGLGRASEDFVALLEPSLQTSDSFGLAPRTCLPAMSRRPQILAEGDQTVAIPGRVTVFEVAPVAWVRLRNLTGVFDRAPILLGASSHFPHVCNQPVGVATEGAVHFFDRVQVGKLVSIDREVSTTGTRGMP